MPFIQTASGRIYYRLQGRDSAPAIVFTHSLGVDHGQWDRQTADLLPRFRVLRYDIRGHGATDATSGDYSIEMLGRDVLALVDALEIREFIFCGLSIGGMVGQWVGASAPDRVTRLVLANTSPKFGDTTLLEARRVAVLKEGMGAAAEMSMSRFFSPEAIALDLPHIASTRRTFLATNPTGYAGCCGAIRDMDLRPLLPRITARTMIVSSAGDVSTPWAGNGEVLAAAIPHAKVVHLPGAHLSNLEEPEAFTAALLDFAGS